MTESYNQRYQPKIEAEILDPITEQYEIEYQKIINLIQELGQKTQKLKIIKEQMKTRINNAKLEKLKQSREGYTNLEIESI